MDKYKNKKIKENNITALEKIWYPLSTNDSSFRDNYSSITLNSSSSLRKELNNAVKWAKKLIDQKEKERLRKLEIYLKLKKTFNE